ncbi:MFS transporter [Candidatus Woesearchaeota archaeon]|nr:MFS transporter [Candidatus Woesearchaeota archaeon]
MADEKEAKSSKKVLQKGAGPKKGEQKEEPSYVKVEKSLNTTIKDAMASSVMQGLTQSYIIPFALALKASNTIIGLLASFPELIGAFFQLFEPALLKLIKSRKKIMVAAAFLQAIVWIPILLIPYIANGNTWLLLALITLQAGIGALVVPVWNSILGDLVPSNQRGEFFGKRNRFVGLATFIATFAAGLILNYFQPRNVFVGFTILFSLAIIFRFTSAYFKSRIYEPPFTPNIKNEFSLLDFTRQMTHTNYGMFVLFITSFKFAAHIASPFLAVYMLQDLHFSYFLFMSLTALEVISSFLFLGIWGKTIDKLGTRRVMLISSLLIPWIPILWVFSTKIWWLVLVQLFSGAVWAGFNLAASNFVFDAVRPENRIRCIAYYNFYVAIGLLAGASLGSYLLYHLRDALLLSAIPAVFVISGVLRLVMALYFAPKLKEVRLIELPLGHSTIFTFNRFLAIRPSEGGSMHPFIIDRQPKKEKQPQLRPKKPDTKDAGPEKEKYVQQFVKRVVEEEQEHKLEKPAKDADFKHTIEDIEKGKFRKK